MGDCGLPKDNDAAEGTQNGRCGFGPRLPLIVVSPWAKTNHIDHALTDQSSVLRFIEDNWELPRIGNGSADAIAGSIEGLFDFRSGPNAGRLILDESTGQIVSH
jgi:phospholipase C